MAQAMFGAGCFWGVQDAFEKLDGVEETQVGYSGGKTDNPTYRQVCSGDTGHVEVVRVVFDESRISYGELLACFFEIHDPTTLNRQGPDVGDQYRSVIFYYEEKQKELAQAARKELDESGELKRPVVTAVEPAQAFWIAEDYHQHYHQRQCSI